MDCNGNRDYVWADDCVNGKALQYETKGPILVTHSTPDVCDIRMLICLKGKLTYVQGISKIYSH